MHYLTLKTDHSTSLKWSCRVKFQDFSDGALGPPWGSRIGPLGAKSRGLH